jgi:antitoxin HicB
MATRSLEEYLDLPYAIALTRGEGDEPWLATVDELPGCEARGRGPEEAARRVQEAMGAWLATALEEGRPVPEPRAAASGRLLVRMPRSLHAELTRAAAREGVSLNQFISSALSAAVGWRRGPGPAAQAAEDDPPPAPPAASAGPPRTIQRLLLVDLVLVLIAVVVAGVLLATA